MKKIIWIPLVVIGSLAILYAIGVFGVNFYLRRSADPPIEKMEYRTDAEPLVKRFGETLAIQSCHWKGGAAGNLNFGPTDYWLKGFALISGEDLANFQTQYELEKAEIDFPKGIDPKITGFDGFDWRHDKALTQKIIGADYMGDFYLDVQNGVFYFDLSTY
jgi:hypothetical protein